MANTLVLAFRNKEVRGRILFTLFTLFIFVLMTNITVPLIDRDVVQQFFAGNGSGEAGFLDFANAFTGGALKNFSIIALGISPYITASIVIQLLQMDIVPVLSEWSKEGEVGKQKLNQLTRYAAIGLAFIQSFAMVLGFQSFEGTIIQSTEPITYLYIAIVMTAGTAVLLWLSDQITAKGIGNGTSMIIMAGIVSQFPNMFKALSDTYITSGQGYPGWIKFSLIVLLWILIIVGVIFMQNAVRKIPVQYANRANSATLSGRKGSHIPIKLNPSGVIPVIFASSLVSVPLTLAQFFPEYSVRLQSIFYYQEPIGFTIYVTLIYVFSFFYAFIQISPGKVAENLHNNGSYIPGVRAGQETENYISQVLLKTVIVGSTYLMVIAILPITLGWIFTDIPSSVQIGGTSLLIVVGVAQETFKQIENKVKTRKYEGFIK